MSLPSNMADGAQVPYLVTGAGGYYHLHGMMKVDGERLVAPVVYDDKQGAVSRLDRALATSVRGLRLRQLRAEQLGALADADPQVEAGIARSRLIDRILVGRWRAVRRVVRDRRDGRETYYRVEPKALGPLLDWISFYAAFWENRIDRLEALLKRMDQ